MSEYGVKLPDVGEGVAEAELISWLVAVGERVTPESVLAEVMTDKATVEISSPVGGVVIALHGQPGDTLAVGGTFVTVELDGDAPSAPVPTVTAPAVSSVVVAPVVAPAVAPVVRDAKAVAAPAVRNRARELGIDLSTVTGSGPEGRVLHADLDRVLAGGGGARRSTAPLSPASDEPHVQQIIGLRRRIAERLTSSWTQIPHITYVEATDVTELEALRAELNARGDGPRLTILPFLVRAMVIACAEQPTLNAHYDSETRTLSTFDAVHVGIATQTDDGLMVPVVRHAEARDVWDVADEIARVSTAAREGRATVQELTGSTITITSLGAIGGLVTTPIINQPEVAIVGVNKIETRPVWRDGAWLPRRQMNLSSSFDHRIIDGWNAATYVQRVKQLLENPAALGA